MTPEQFDVSLQKLMKEFPSKYSDGKVKIIYESLKNMSQLSFERIIRNFILTSRNLPTPKELIDACLREPRTTQEVYSPPLPPRCEWCFDSGVMEVIYKSAQKELFIGCLCGIKNHTSLPRWVDAHSFQFEKIKMDALKWKPKAFDPENPTDSVKDVVEIWNIKMKVSLLFWEELLGKGPNDAA